MVVEIASTAYPVMCLRKISAASSLAMLVRNRTAIGVLWSAAHADGDESGLRRNLAVAGEP